MSWAIWITGPPGSGKTTVARATAAALAADGQPVELLELDEMRKIVTPRPTYSDSERELVYRALVYVAASLVGVGLPVIIDATAHRRKWRDFARAVLPAFAEAQLVCPLDVCKERERTRRPGHAPRAIYEAAGRAGSRVPGVDVEYEASLAPELTLDTTSVSAQEAGARVAALARTLPMPSGHRDGPAWAIWITGLPGSGKTTLASRLAEALAGYGVQVRLLDPGEVRACLAYGPRGPLDEELIHRTLVYTAKRLTEAGVPVVIDATAPVRAWRDLGRALIPRFAEVQLLCPPETCAARERAVRWRLIGCPQGPTPPADEIELALAYEHSLHPDAAIHTDVQDAWSASQTVLLLAWRLHGAPGGVPEEMSWRRSTAHR